MFQCLNQQNLSNSNKPKIICLTVSDLLVQSQILDESVKIEIAKVKITNILQNDMEYLQS